MAISKTEIYNWAIYKITNPNGRVYIGKASNIATRRTAYQTAGAAIKQQRVVYNSILKYGFDGHTFEVIDSFQNTNDYASGKEIFWIRSFMSNGNKWPEMKGMNLTDGGEGARGAKFPNRVSPMKGKKMSEKTKSLLRAAMSTRKIPLSMLGKNHSAESKAKMSASKKGMVSIFKGKKHSPESLRKLSESKKGKPSWNKGIEIWTEEQKKNIGIHHMKVVLKYDKDGVFIKEYGSIQSAADELSVTTMSIYKVLKGDRKYVRGFNFKYKK